VLQPGQGVGKVLDWAFSHFDLKTKKKLYAAFWREVVSRAEAEELSGKRKSGSSLCYRTHQTGTIVAIF
jgi:hypothetical protein